MPMNLPETGGGNVKWGSASRMAGRIVSVKFGDNTGSFTNFATCWVAELKFVCVATPLCMTQDMSLQDFFGVFAAFPQQQVGDEKRLIELSSLPGQCEIFTRKPKEASKMAAIKLK